MDKYMCDDCDLQRKCAFYEDGYYIKDCKDFKPMTNDEWRRTCSTEEFAEFVRQQRDDWSDGWYSDWHPFSEIIEWLKEKHTP